MKILLNIRGVRSCPPRDCLKIKLTILLFFLTLFNIRANVYSFDHLMPIDLADRDRNELGVNEIVSQQIEISGTVKDVDGEVLPGANIVLKGTSKGVVSDFDGNFTIAVPNAQAVLVVSFIGMETKEVVVGNNTSLEVLLDYAAEKMDEVVVTALGMKREKKALGYAVAVVEAEALNQQPNTNVLSGLSGKMSGVQINEMGGDINAKMNVIIRGQTSLTSNNEPLLVIDGSPVGNTDAMRDISSLDIASVSVLKGASAAALYGSRAGNGVILITTKSGEGAKQGIGVSFTQSTTLSVPYSYFELQNTFTTGQKGQFNESSWQYWYGPRAGVEVVQWNTNGQPQPLVMYDNSLQDFFQTGLSTQTDASVSGNYDRGSFNFSINHMKSDGITPGMELKRLGFSLATSYKITDKVKLTTNITISKPTSDNLPLTNNGSDDIYMDIFANPPHVNINDLKDYWEIEGSKQRRAGALPNNPWFSAYERDRTLDQIRGFGNVRLDIDILPGLTAMGRVAYSANNEKIESIYPWSYDGFGSSAVKPFGAYEQTKLDEREANVDFLFSYDKKVGDFRINPSVGGNYLNSKNTSLYGGGDVLTLPALYTLSNVARPGLGYNSGVFEKEIYSLYGLASLSFKEMVYLDLTARNDWSSTLPKENRSYFYPSASLSMLVSEMTQMPSWVSLVKLRTGWAEVGKDTDPYSINPILNQTFWGNDIQYSVPASLPNTALKPEIATSYEVGTDLGFVNNRIVFEGTWYKTQNRNQIIGVTTSPMSGFSSATINAGNVENTGIELALNTVPVRTADFEWNLGFNFTKQESRLVELVEGIDRIGVGNAGSLTQQTFVGGIIGDLYSTSVLRVESGEYEGWPILNNNGGLTFQTDNALKPKVGKSTNDFNVGMNTSVKYKNFTLSANLDWRQGGNFYSETMKRTARSGWVDKWQGDAGTFSGVLGSNSFNGDRTALANEIKSNPDVYQADNVWIGGRDAQTGGFEYNGFNNGSFWPGVIKNSDGTYTENFGGPGTVLFDAYKVVEPGGGLWDVGSSFMYDLSFVKLRNITLTYDLPQKFASKISAQRVSFSVFTKNIMLWNAADIGIDPELAYYQNNGSYDIGKEKWNALPWVAPVGFTINLTF